MTTAEAQEALIKMGIPVRIKTAPGTGRSDNALKSIVLNPAVRPETRAAALAELQSRKETGAATVA